MTPLVAGFSMRMITNAGAVCKLALSSLLLALLPACEPMPNLAQQDTSVSSIEGYNYTIEGIQTFSVNGEWGSNISPGSGGRSIVCCVEIPKKWKPGLSATVKWERTDCRNDEKRCPKRIEDVDKWPMLHLTKEVPVEPYDRPYTTYVVFLPGDEVKIYVSTTGPDHPDHPSRLGKVRPLDYSDWRRP